MKRANRPSRVLSFPARKDAVVYFQLEEDLRNLAARQREVRQGLVSRLCHCYEPDAPWEDRAAWCSHRLLGSCPFYTEAKRRSAQ